MATSVNPSPASEKPEKSVRVLRQLAYYEPSRPNLLPVPMGRKYGYGPRSDRRLKAALDRFNALFARDPRCTCLIGVFEVVCPARAPKGGAA